MIKFTAINIQYEDDKVSRYIVSYDSHGEGATISGQVNISANDADLSNIIDVTKEVLKVIINGE